MSLNQRLPFVAILVSSRVYRGGDGSLMADFPGQPGTPVPLQGVPVFFGGGGTPAVYARSGIPEQQTDVPLAQRTQFVIQWTQTGDAIAIGARVPPNGVAASEPATDAGIRPQGATAADHVAQNGGSWAVLDALGRFVVDLTSAAEGLAGIQLPSAGVLRVSRAGAAAGRLTLAGRAVTLLSSWRTSLITLAADVVVLQNSVLGPAVPPRVPVTFTDPATANLACATIPVSADAENAP